MLNPLMHTSNQQIFWIKAFLVIFYGVGIVGLLMPITRGLFIKLIPIALLLSMAVVLRYHKHNYSLTTIVVFILIYLFSFIIEAIGVHTGVIFGHYYYGNGLGIKVFETPLIIGLNWLLLVYTTASVIDRFMLVWPLSIFLASSCMVVYDVVLEKIAPLLDMWYWFDGVIPNQNFLSWFVLAVIFHSSLKLFRIRTANRLAPVVLICQFLFFLILLGAKKLFL